MEWVARRATFEQLEWALEVGLTFQQTTPHTGQTSFVPMGNGGLVLNRHPPFKDVVSVAHAQTPGVRWGIFSQLRLGLCLLWSRRLLLQRQLAPQALAPFNQLHRPPLWL